MKNFATGFPLPLSYGWRRSLFYSSGRCGCSYHLLRNAKSRWRESIPAPRLWGPQSWLALRLYVVPDSSTSGIALQRVIFFDAPLCEWLLPVPSDQPALINNPGLRYGWLLWHIDHSL